MEEQPNDKDIAALESITELKNYNNFVFKQISNFVKGKKVLDFGSGYGDLCLYLKNLNYDIDGYDINQTAIEKTRLKDIKTYNKISQINQKYDTVTSLNVLEHVKDDVGLIIQIKSLLVDNGTLVLYLPASPIVWTKMDEEVNHFRRYTKKDIEEKLINANYEIEYISFVDFIGWLVLLVMKFFRIQPKFNKKLLIFYDKVFFRYLKIFDFLFKKLIGKNLLIVAKLKEK